MGHSYLYVFLIICLSTYTEATKHILCETYTRNEIGVGGGGGGGGGGGKQEGGGGQGGGGVGLGRGCSVDIASMVGATQFYFGNEHD